MSSGPELGVPLGDLLAGHTGRRATMWLVSGLGAVSLTRLAALLPTVPTAPAVSVRARLAAVTDRAVAPAVQVSFLAAGASIGRLVDRVVRAAGAGRVAALVGVIMAVITGAEAVLPVFAPVPLLAGAARSARRWAAPRSRRGSPGACCRGRRPGRGRRSGQASDGGPGPVGPRGAHPLHVAGMSTLGLYEHS